MSIFFGTYKDISCGMVNVDFTEIFIYYVILI